MEKEQSYQDAANSYEKAWKFANQNNPTIGEYLIAALSWNWICFEDDGQEGDSIMIMLLFIANSKILRINALWDWKRGPAK